MLKSRRDKFEDQLRALQTDINDLSHKMSAPAAYSSNVYSSPVSTNHQQKKANTKGDYSGSSKTSTVKSSGRQTSNGSNVSLSHSALLSSIHSQGSIEEKPAPLSQNFLSIVLPNDHPSTETGSLGSSARFEHIPTEHSEDTVVRVERADSLDNNYSLIRERNSLLTRLEQAHSQIEDLRKAVLEGRELQSLYDRLVQDHELVQVSLESSERIRKQQKELINLLQRTAAYEGPDPSLSPTTVSTAAENSNWLNAFGFSTHNAFPIPGTLLLDPHPSSSSSKPQPYHTYTHTQNQNQNRAKVISNLDHFLDLNGPRTQIQNNTQTHTPYRVGSASAAGKGPGPGPGFGAAVSDTGGPSKRVKSAGVAKKRVVGRSKGNSNNSNSNSNSNSSNAFVTYNGINNSTLGGSNPTHNSINSSSSHNNSNSNSSGDHQSSRPLSASHRTQRAQTLGHNLENRSTGHGGAGESARDRKVASQQDDKHATPPRGHTTHTPLAHTHMPSPSSRYDEQVQRSLESLGFESAPGQDVDMVRVRPAAVALRGSPQRPRSAPSPVTGSPTSLRNKGGNVDGSSSARGEARGGGIAAMGKGEQSNRRGSAGRSHSTDRSAFRQDAGREGQGQRAAFSDAPIYLPQRISGRPPMTPTHTHTPLAPTYTQNPRSAPHSAMKSTSSRPSSHTSAPSYNRV